MGILNFIAGDLNDFIWGWFGIAILLGTGILMTVLTMMIGMIPLVIEGGAGANGNRALALGVIGGMSIGTIALLFVVPAFFIVFQKLHEKFQGAG